MKGDKLGREGGSGNQEQPRTEIMKGDKLGTQGGSGNQEQPRREIMKGDKRGRKFWQIMKGDKLGRQGGSGVATKPRFRKSVTQSLRSKNPYNFQLSGERDWYLRSSALLLLQNKHWQELGLLAGNRFEEIQCTVELGQHLLWSNSLKCLQCSPPSFSFWGDIDPLELYAQLGTSAIEPLKKDEDFTKAHIPWTNWMPSITTQPAENATRTQAAFLSRQNPKRRVGTINICDQKVRENCLCRCTEWMKNNSRLIHLSLACRQTRMPSQAPVCSPLDGRSWMGLASQSFHKHVLGLLGVSVLQQSPSSLTSEIATLQSLPGSEDQPNAKH